MVNSVSLTIYGSSRKNKKVGALENIMTYVAPPPAPSHETASHYSSNV